MSQPKRGTGSIFKFKGCGNWYIKFHKNGKPVRESSGSDKQRVAETLLRKRVAEVSTNTYVEASDRKITVDELYSALLADYENNGLASLEGARQRWQSPAKDGQPAPPAGRLKKYFGGLRALSIDTTKLNAYVSQCRAQGLANATINRDLSALRRAFYLAEDAGRIQKVPTFPHLKESAPRSGFVEETVFNLLAANAGELWLRALITTAYSFAFRKSELLNLRVNQVDLMNRAIRLHVGETKSGEGRLVKLTSDVFVLLQLCVAGKSPDDYVFTRSDGKPVLDFRERWEKLTAAAGCPGLLFHDLRRSSVRNMVRRGIPEVVAMRISGHKTRDVFDRYNIVSESDLDDAARKIEAGQVARKIEAGQVWAEVGQNSPEKHPNQGAAVAPLTQ